MEEKKVTLKLDNVSKSFAKIENDSPQSAHTSILRVTRHFKLIHGRKRDIKM